ncbi:MAG: M28 family peptidase [Parasphingorhabdus sp.]|uniref:M28 family peptidase n=1 Tax=Parasphingorhabdus sp. TaxID=2709688 RepID=UPI003296B39B
MTKANFPSALLGTAISTLIFSTSAFAETQDVREIQAKALEDNLAFEITEGLTTEIGPRQGGTEAETRARQWAVNKLTDLGFGKVRIEQFMMPTWVRGEETAEIIAPFPQKLAITALGNSGSTGANGLEAEVVFFPTVAALAAVPDGSLNGKIAFVSHQMRRSQDGSSYGAFGAVRFFGPNIAAQKGASAMVIRSVGTDYRRNPHTGNTNFSDRVAPIPAAALSIPDAENLRRMIERSEEPVKMKLVLTPQNIGQQESGNVIAEVAGTDPSLSMVLIACHLDSWDLGTGAIDDGAGCGIITAAAKLIMESEIKPKRTIRLLWAGAEEVGVWGGKDYAVVHKDTPHALAMESDFGADRVWRVEFNLPESAKETQDKIISSLGPLGIGHNPSIVAGGGADVRPIIGAQNLAIIDLQQDGTRYFDLHHTPDDTLDKIDPKQLRQNVAAWTTVLSIIANSEIDFTLPPKE